MWDQARARFYILMFVVLSLSTLLLRADLVSSATQAPVTKDTREVVAFADFKDPPGTLAEMVAEADLVAHVVMLDDGISGNTEFFVRGIPALTTAYRATVLDVLRAPAVEPTVAAGAEIVIVRPGGTIDRGSHFERHRIAGFDFFRKNRKYVLFLRWKERLAVWTPKYGPHGSFELITGRVVTEAKSGVARKQANKTEKEFIATIKKMGNRF